MVIKAGQEPERRRCRKEQWWEVTMDFFSGKMDRSSCGTRRDEIKKQYFSNFSLLHRNLSAIISYLQITSNSIKVSNSYLLKLIMIIILFFIFYCYILFTSSFYYYHAYYYYLKKRIVTLILISNNLTINHQHYCIPVLINVMNKVARLYSILIRN